MCFSFKIVYNQSHTCDGLGMMLIATQLGVKYGLGSKAEVLMC